MTQVLCSDYTCQANSMHPLSSSLSLGLQGTHPDISDWDEFLPSVSLVAFILCCFFFLCFLKTTPGDSKQWQILYLFVLERNDYILPLTRTSSGIIKKHPNDDTLTRATVWPRPAFYLLHSSMFTSCTWAVIFQVLDLIFFHSELTAKPYIASARKQTGWRGWRRHKHFRWLSPSLPPARCSRGSVIGHGSSRFAEALIHVCRASGKKRKANPKGSVIPGQVCPEPASYINHWKISL